MMEYKDNVKDIPTASEKIKKLGNLDGKAIRFVSKNEYQNTKNY
jgi:hypothetical protein